VSTGAIVLPPAVRRAIVAHARRDAPRECCGFLVGKGRIVGFAVAATNLEEGEVRYRIDPRAHIELRRAVRAFAPPLSILGTYHSHPAGRAVPSDSDIAEAFYPEWVYVIVALGATRPCIRGFRINSSRVREVQITSTTV
jgi:proteasome lid subunit RPN8/RPN11